MATTPADLAARLRKQANAFYARLSTLADRAENTDRGDPGLDAAGDQLRALETGLGELERIFSA